MRQGQKQIAGKILEPRPEPVPEFEMAKVQPYDSLKEWVKVKMPVSCMTIYMTKVK